MFIYVVYTVRNMIVCLGIDYDKAWSVAIFANSMVVGSLAISFGHVSLCG